MAMDAISWWYLGINSFLEWTFVLNLLHFLWHSPAVPKQLTALNPLNTFAGLYVMFAVMDFFYAPAHRFLHWTPVYPYVMSFDYPNPKPGPLREVRMQNRTAVIPGTHQPHSSLTRACVSIHAPTQTQLVSSPTFSVPRAPRYVHKHHHRQVFPAQGYLDAGNEHPVEQVGELVVHVPGGVCTIVAECQKEVGDLDLRQHAHTCMRAVTDVLLGWHASRH